MPRPLFAALPLLLLAACGSGGEASEQNLASDAGTNTVGNAGVSDPGQPGAPVEPAADPVPPPDAVSHPDGYLPPAPAEPSNSATPPAGESPPATEDEYIRNGQGTR